MIIGIVGVIWLFAVHGNAITFPMSDLLITHLSSSRCIMYSGVMV